MKIGTYQLLNRSYGHTTNKTREIIRQEENNPSILLPITNKTNDRAAQIKSENTITYETNTDLPKSIARLGNDLFRSNEVSNTQATRHDITIEERIHGNNNKMVMSTDKYL